MSFVEDSLGNYVNFSNGKSSPERADAGKFPVYGSNGLIGYSDKINAPNETSVIGRVGSYCGSIHFSRTECWVTDNAIKATPKDPKEARFWFYSMLNRDLHDLRSGSGQPLLNQAALNSTSVFVPPKFDRLEIAAILGALDDKIEVNRKASATLEAMTRALYRSWFVDFDPVWAKLEGRPPAHMNPATAALFPDSFDDVGLPMGWEKIAIGKLFSDVIGGDWGIESSTGANCSPVYIIRGTDMPDLASGGVAKVPQRFTTAKKSERRELQPFDIVIEVSGGSPTQPTGRVLLVTETLLDRFDSRMVPASFCRRMRPLNPQAALQSFLHIQQLYLDGGTWDYQNQSTGISNFQTTRFLEDEFIIRPTTELLEAFYSRVLNMLVYAHSNQSLTLTTLRDSLLPKLMSGEIRVADARAQVEEIV